MSDRPQLDRLVLRPRLARWVPLVSAIVFTVSAVVLGVFLPSPPWNAYNKAGVIVVVLAIAYVLYRLSTARIVIDGDTVQVVNPRVRRTFSRAQIVAVNLDPAAPWAVLDLADGSTMSAMGIQGSEGALAREQVEQLRGVLREI